MEEEVTTMSTLHRLKERTWVRRMLALQKRMGRDKVGIVAAGLALYALLGLFPALVALVSIAGLFLDPSQVESQLAFLTDTFPGDAGRLVTDQLSPLAGMSRGLLSLGIVVGLGGAIWSASTAVNNVFGAMEVAHDVDEGRGFVVNRGLAVLFALGALAVGLALLAILAFLPSVLDALQLGSVVDFFFTWGRWPLLALIVFGSFVAVYRFGIRRKHAYWRPILKGALFGTGIWVVASAAFAVYVAYFANYGQFYGGLSSVIVLLMWFLVSGFAIVLGAELNAIIERERDDGPEESVEPRP